MTRQFETVSVFLALAVASFLIRDASAQQTKPETKPQVVMLQRAPQPNGWPRPESKSENVPIATSIFFRLTLPEELKGDDVLPGSVVVRLQTEGGEAIELLRAGRNFVQPASGFLRPQRGHNEKTIPLCVYIEPGKPLKPTTTYTVRVQARSKRGLTLPDADGTWSFRTAAASKVHPLKFPVDLGAEPVRWHGHFFSGICNVVFCTKAELFHETYEMMDRARKLHPNAWSFHRDFWLTGTEDFGGHHVVPNIVREVETRRITAMEPRTNGVLLHVDDVFGHQQYGVASNRPLSNDYHPGDEVLVADNVNDARSKVLAVDDQAKTVLVGLLAAPADGWKIAYEGPLPTKENPDAPGLFAPGGCYLRKFRPHGTACYYWGRIDKEWDLVVRRYNRRLLVNFADAPWDLAVDGHSWTTAKDYAQWHDVVRTITDHLIVRYGDKALTFTYSIFNEADLQKAFWHAGWDELQRYYDYTTDAVLRAFEDRGYDSNKVFIGGLELGGIFGTNLRLQEFLAHCSPRASAKGALPLNAAFADPRLNGKRSRRVESLCREHGGKGCPCDFISIHSYNRSEMMAAKLIRAKEMALEIDPEYYRDMWTNSHENCPDWTRQADEAAGDLYLDNGYCSTWCVDMAARLLRRAARDPRYAFGETVLTVWPTIYGLTGTNVVTRILRCDDNGDGRADRNVTIPTQAFHVLTMLSDFGDRYWPLPEQQVGGHSIAGFASRDVKGVVRVLVYSHNAADTQSRSDEAFDVAVELDRLGWPGPARVQEYRFDRDHNSYFREAKALEKQRPARGAGDDSHTVYGRDQVERLRQLAQCRPTASAIQTRQPDGRLRVTARVAGNGMNILVIEPARAGK